MLQKVIMTTWALVLLTGTASAAQITTINAAVSGESSIWIIYKALYHGAVSKANIGSYENDLAIGGGLYSQIGPGGTVTWVARNANDSFVLYTYDPQNPSKTFGPLNMGSLTNDTISTRRIHSAGIPPGTPTIFGFKFVDTTTGQQWFTQKGFNGPPDDRYHFLVLNGTEHRLLVGVEDRTTGTDWDFNDSVFEFKNIIPQNP